MLIVAIGHQSWNDRDTRAWCTVGRKTPAVVPVQWMAVFFSVAF